MVWAGPDLSNQTEKGLKQKNPSSEYYSWAKSTFYLYPLPRRDELSGASLNLYILLI